MGKLTLFLVLAAVVGGSILTVQTRSTLGEASLRHAESQADLLAREIAETGQSLALSRLMAPGGFVDPGLSGPREYNGGTFEVAVDEISPNGRHATISVTGTYGGAVHRVHSTYEFDPMEVPGPIWLDVPSATADVSKNAQISGDRPVQLDPRAYHDLGLSELVPLSSLTSSLDGSLRKAGTSLNVPDAETWDDLMEDLNVDDTEGLYQAALAAFDASTDRKLRGARTITNSVTWGGPDKITLIEGDLTVGSRTAHGSVRGSGALVVRGALRVKDRGSLDWDGLIIVRDTLQELSIELDGDVRIDGALAVAQQAVPPGGHLDVSVYRDVDGMRSNRPWGDVSRRPSPWHRSNYPFHQHTHAFDITPTGAERGQHVYFMEDGRAGRHEVETQFYSTLRSLGSEKVYLEFGNTDNHGYSRYVLALDGSDPVSRAVQDGFGGFGVPSGGDAIRTAAFRANDLDALDLNVRSLRALRQAFDGQGGCTSWPICIGRAWDREDALALRVVRERDAARLYEASFYWHMRPDERALHEAEERAWRRSIQNGENFGTRLRIGDDVAVTLDLSQISPLADKLGFDGNELVPVASSTVHWTPAETRAGAFDNEGSNAGLGDGPFTVCHRGKTEVFSASKYEDHRDHTTMGPCSGDSGDSGGSGGSGDSGSGGSGGSGDSGD